MATDKHYNEPGVMPEPLEDPKGTDMPATRYMFLIIAALAIFAVAVVVALQMSS